MGGVLGFGSRGSASLGLLRSFPFEIRGVSIPNSEGNGGLCVCGFSIGLALLIGARILRDTKEKKAEIKCPHNFRFKKSVAFLCPFRHQSSEVLGA